jgi:unsaturated rhamnogalacturonyl hydrolase
MKTPAFFLLIMMPLLLISEGSNTDKDKSPRDAKEVARLVTADLLSRPEIMMYNTDEVKAVHYAEACAGYGAIKLAGLLKDTATLQELVRRYNRVSDEHILNTANHVDANVYGILPLELYLQTDDEKYLKQGLELADGQWEDPLPDGMTRQTRYWIDDVYMISCLQVQAYRATGNMIYLERAALEVDAYIQKLQQPNGLFFHGPEAHYFWGRGNGWVAAGMAELLLVLPEDNSHYASILVGYKKMMKTLADCQAEDGMWCQLIDHPESFRETSSTAMFGFAMTVGVKKGLLPGKTYRQASRKAWNALTEYLNEDGKIREVCVGTGQSKVVNFYLTRPRVTGDLHGQAPLLWFAYSRIVTY